MRVQATTCQQLPVVATDGTGLVSHAGIQLLAETADRLGLTDALARAGRSRSRRARHQTGRILRDLVVMLADGGRKPADLAALREQPELLGPVASDATVSRVIAEVAADPKARAALASARTRFRERVWRAGGAPPGDGPLRVDLDATLVDADSEKDGAAGTYKGGFGFSPILGWLDRGDGRGEALAGLLRPGNDSPNHAGDQLAALNLALLGLPREERARRGVLVRIDAAGASHEVVDHLTDRKLGYSISFPVTQAIHQAAAALPTAAWLPAVDACGRPRNGARVAELPAGTLPGWPERMRLLVRRERPHPGAQLTLWQDLDGDRLTCLATDTPRPDIQALEARHRDRAHCEQRIRDAKATALDRLPYQEFDRNQVWVDLVLCAVDLLGACQTLLLDGALRLAAPATVRFRLLHVAARLAVHARQQLLRLDRTWPWVDQLATAFARLRALPLPAG